MAVGFSLGAFILANAIYLFTFGGWPVYEDGKLSHGLYHRMSGAVILAHAAMFYIFALKVRRPRWRILPLYLVSLGAVYVGSLLTFDMAWKADDDFRVGWPLAIAFAIAAASIPMGTRPPE